MAVTEMDYLSGGGGPIGPIPFTPSSVISSNTIVATQGMVSLVGEIVLSANVDAGDTLISGLPVPSSAINIANGAQLKGSSSTRTLTVDTSGNLKLASGESYMGSATWVISVSYSTE